MGPLGKQGTILSTITMAHALYCPRGNILPLVEVMFLVICIQSGKAKSDHQLSVEIRSRAARY